MHKRFLQAVLPAMLAFTFNSLFAIVDGFFVGRNVGDLGLAAVNIAFPLVSLVMALGTGLGMGGAVQLAEARGRGDHDQASRVLGTTLVLLALASLIITSLYLLAYRPLLAVLGAAGQVMTHATAYIKVIALGAACQLFSSGLAPILRNYGASLPAMLAMVSGFVTNIILDALFVSVFQWGLAGAAWATILGQAITLLFCLIFLRKELRRLPLTALLPSRRSCLNTLKIGGSPFGVTLCPNLSILLINRAAVTWGGDTAVAAYAVISYVVCIGLLLLQGVSDGSQPLISFYVGCEDQSSVRQIRRMAYRFGFGTALLTFLLLVLLRRQIPIFFGASAAASEMAAAALPLFAFGILFVSFCRVATAYFYSVHHTLPAYILTYGEPALLLILLLILPYFFKLSGVWAATPVAQVLLALIVPFLQRRAERTSVIPLSPAQSTAHEVN